MQFARLVRGQLRCGQHLSECLVVADQPSLKDQPLLPRCWRAGVTGLQMQLERGHQCICSSSNAQASKRAAGKSSDPSARGSTEAAIEGGQQRTAERIDHTVRSTPLRLSFFSSLSLAPLCVRCPLTCSHLHLHDQMRLIRIAQKEDGGLLHDDTEGSEGREGQRSSWHNANKATNQDQPEKNQGKQQHTRGIDKSVHGYNLNGLVAPWS